MSICWSDPESRVIDELEFSSYAHNRMQFTEVPPERWAVIFSNAPAMEERFLKTFISKLLEAEEEIGEVGHA
jgi:hypothetical protein